MTAQLDPQPLIHDEPTKSPSTTAAAVLGMLRRHYLPDESRPAGIFAPEIQAPGSTRRKADLIWLGCAAATGKQLVGHEIKVTRSDVLAELADLTKSDPWQRYCDRWYLVVPHLALIKGLDLPETWGLLTLPSGRRTRSMTMHRQAPPLQPLEQAPALRTVAAWLHWQLRDARNQAADRQRRLDRALDDVRQLQLSAAPRTHNPTREVVEQTIAALGGAHGYADEVGDWRRSVKVGDVVAALRDLGTVYKRRDEVLRTLDGALEQLESLGARVARVLADTRAAS